MGEAALLDRKPAVDAEPTRFIFMVELTPDPDGLARLLVPFAVVQAPLALVEYRASEIGAVVRLEATGLDPDRAQLLKRRLEQAPCVLRVGLGWSSTSSAMGLIR